MPALTHVDVCSGIGAFGIAAAHAGFRTAAFCEIEEYPRRVLARHFPKAYIHDDLKTLTGDTLRNRGIDHVDLFSGGIPCQPFSVAGKRCGTSDDRHLWPEALRFIADMRPNWVCIENVAGFIPVALDLVLSELEAEGYSAGAVVLPACAVNAPHRRDRVWIVGHAPRKLIDGAVLARSGGCGLADTSTLGNTCDGGLYREPRRGAGQKPADGYSQLEEVNEGMVNPRRSRREECDIPALAGNAGHSSRRPDAKRSAGAAQSGMGGVPYGTACWLDGLRWPAPLGASPFEWEPARTATGIKNRTVRLKACGNAIVWPVAAAIFGAIREAIC